MRDKDGFLRELSYLLSDLTQEEREEALAYYRDYFEEAGPEREQEILEGIGSPEKAAAELKSSLRGDTGYGEYTEHGYYDERFDEKNRVPDFYTQMVKRGTSRSREDGTGEDSQDRGRAGGNRNALLVILLFIFIGLPLAGSIISAGFSVVAGLIGGVFGIFGGLIGLVVGGMAAVIGLLAGGVGMIITGIFNLSAVPIGLMGISLGLFLLAAATLMAVLVKWGFQTAVPGVFGFGMKLIRMAVELAGRGCRWIVTEIRGLFGKGGEAG